MSFQLNPQQRAAVRHTDTPLLVLAGAGSGKTRVITQKIAHLIQQRGFDAQHIAAVTFTNKAAREMQQRVSSLLPGDSSRELKVSTFHTLGLNIIRQECKALGLRPGFSIYDSQDSEALIRELMRRKHGATQAQEEGCRWQFSQWKNDCISPAQAISSAEDELQLAHARLYERYNHYLRTYNAVDFDDLINLPVTLFTEQPEILGGWQERIRYLLVDEYQDTNTSQYILVKLLVSNRKGLTVVGDDDQSVYGWRGAQPENLFRLQDDFPDLKIIKLEQNYRSMNNILASANALIANNSHVFEKRLWSDKGRGEKIRVLHTRNSDHEAERVVSQIIQHRFQHGCKYHEYAILYRGNYQSRPFERLLREQRIPYYLSGGLSFFERSEIKDLMAYLRLLGNPDDDAAFLRIVNTPRRGLGPTTIEKIANYAHQQHCSLLDAGFNDSLQSQLTAKPQQSLARFLRMIIELGDRAKEGESLEVINELIKQIDYEKWLYDQSPDPVAAERRMENVNEFIDWIRKIVKRDSDTSLAEIITQLTLMDRLDREEEDGNLNAVHLMTLHSAKGLEFNHVFMTGMEENILPHQNSIKDSLEEERRLAYVGITRARTTLTLTLAGKRKRFGEEISCEPSRFLEELPQEELVWEGKGPTDPEQKKQMGKAHLSHLRSMLAE